MEVFKLHNLGQNDHLKIIKEKYNILRNEIAEKKNLNELEKKAELKKLKSSYNKEKRELLNNLY